MDRTLSVSSPYGYRGRWGAGRGGYHYGLDLHGRRGDPVYAAAAARVGATGSEGAYGRRLRLDHGSGLSSFYAHLDRILVTVGDPVRRGEVIGRVGSTGNATGPHLHFELRWNGRWVDPLVVLPRLE
ncbi:MAG: M23 family metallopeptidase [Gemmatimonadetes bacterium]|nr:M23 family metallopeptidase [Gemmatimonadota bacterium]